MYLVEDLKLQRRAALKLIAANLTSDPERRQRFLQEATLAASIDHPHIAAVYEIDEANGRTFIAMEYVRGGSLREALRAGPLKPRRAIELAVQIGDALAKVHERGVVHRDLKPENVLVTDDGYAKVIDFGVAKLLDPLRQAGRADAATMAGAEVRTADGLVLGTMAYMSPEQARGETVDPRSDIFSFGALLQEMLTGSSPFKRGSAAETLSAILTQPASPVQVEAGGAETELQRIVRKCLVKDAGSRYQSMRDVVVDLREAREALGSGTAMVQPRAAASRRLSRRQWGLAAAAVGIAAFLTVAAVWLWGRKGPADPAATAGTSRPAIAVLAFDVISASQDLAWLAKGLPSMLVTGLAQTADVEVVGLERLSDAARQTGAATLDEVPRARWSEVARRAGARFVVIGSLAQAGEQLRIDARVEDLTSGGVRFAESVRGADPFALADDLAARIRSRFNIQPAGAVRKVTDVASTAVEAFRAYTSGLEAFYNVRLDDARRLFEEAVRGDPDFAAAYHALARLAEFVGDAEGHRRYLAQALQRIDRLPDRDAQMLRAAVARSEERWDDSTGILEGVIAAYPDAEDAYLDLGNMFFPLAGPQPDPERAYVAYARGAEALPYSAGMRNVVGYGHMANGRLEEAVASFEVYTKMRPTEANALDSLAEGQLVLGDVGEAERTYRRAMEAGREDSTSGRVWALAVLGRFDEALAGAATKSVTRLRLPRVLVLSRAGRYREAASQIADERRAATGNEPLAALALIEGLLSFERGDCGTALQRFENARATLRPLMNDKQRPWIVLADVLTGTCEARRQRRDRAHAALERARQSHRPQAPNEKWWVAALDGEAALAAGDAAGAMSRFEAGEPVRKMVYSNFNAALSFFANNLILRDGRARAAAAAGRTGEAIAIYRALLTPGRESKWTAMYEPRYVLALARLLEQTGQRAAARAEYERFLDLWKDADRDLPELAEARTALSRVR
ncbi:MAG: protein kinase domain-containing protein [Acidobacteriota bacterium]